MAYDLSVVWVSRDDNYANGVNDRLVRSINSIKRVSECLAINLDLIVVDWNSPSERGLKGFLTEAGIRNIRIIEVDETVISKYHHLQSKPFLEFIAKNIGIRRALAGQVACINADITMSLELLGLCVNRVFLQESFLRADRLDVLIENGEVSKNLELHIRHGASQDREIHLQPGFMNFYHKGSKKLTGEKLDSGLIIGKPGGLDWHFQLGLHTNAAGDFICTSKDNWISANGFPEESWVTTMGDALMVARLAALNLRQIISPGPNKLFHEDHPRDPSRGGAWDKSMWPSFLDVLVATARGQLDAPDEMLFGLPQEKLRELYL